MKYVFEPEAQVVVSVAGSEDLFPVRRIYCVGRNYAAHAREMGFDPDREPIGRWTYGRVTLLGDAAHPMLQYLAQGACMAMEDAVTLGEALRVNDGDFAKAFALYERSRIARTARVVLSAREMGRIYHAKGVERLVRNDLWRGRAPERFYDALEWLYGWSVDNCLAA